MDVPERFVERHWGIAVRIARIRAAQAPSIETDDILSDATMGLLTAARSYRREKGRTEESWAKYKIERAITDGLRNRRGRPGSRRNAAAATVPLSHHHGPILDNTDQNVDRAAVHAAVASLSERHRQVIVWRYYDDLDLSEIAYHMGTSTSAVSHLLKGIHARLHAQLTSQ